MYELRLRNESNYESLKPDMRHKLAEILTLQCTDHRFIMRSTSTFDNCLVEATDGTCLKNHTLFARNVAKERMKSMLFKRFKFLSEIVK